MELIRVTVSDHGRVWRCALQDIFGLGMRFEEDLLDDWELTHEMAHPSFPSVEGPFHWSEDGIATFGEALARGEDGAVPFCGQAKGGALSGSGVCLIEQYRHAITEAGRTD